MTDALSLTQDLIRCPSLTPSDAGCMEIIVRRLEPFGFQAEWLDFGETRNLWLRRGAGTPLFAFLGHTDVVPTGPVDRWRFPPFEPTLHEGRLYGRGAADMKSGVAAMVCALERFVREHPKSRGSIALLLTSDEEGDARDGVVRVMEVLTARGEKIDWCLVGEPSSFDRLGDVVRVGRRGSLCGRLTVHGVQGHIAYPDKVINPIHRFAPALDDLCREQWDLGNAHFPPTQFQVSNIHAGTGAENVVPGELSVLFNLRYSTELTAEEIDRRVRAILDRHAVDYHLDWHSTGRPFLTRGSTLLDAVQAALNAVLGHGARPDTGGGTSDGRFVAPTGAEVVELGPINETIHKIDECVAVEDIERLARVYQHVLSRLLA